MCKNRQILVFGGNRYFGKRLVRRLLDNGDLVTVANRSGNHEYKGETSLRVLSVNREDPVGLNQLSRERFDLVYDQICYSSLDVKIACDAFSGKVGHWVHTSTGSVYPVPKGGLSESDFDPNAHAIKVGPKTEFDYGEGKRQAEAVLFQSAKFPVSALRIPIVLGPDDYTGRLEFHTDRVRSGSPIWIENLEARTGFISSEEASEILFWIGMQKVPTGPMNACSDGTITMGQLINLIEQAQQKKAHIVDRGEEKDHTPFLEARDWYLDNQYAKKIGFQFKGLESWLRPLIAKSSAL